MAVSGVSNVRLQVMCQHLKLIKYQIKQYDSVFKVVKWIVRYVNYLSQYVEINCLHFIIGFQLRFKLIQLHMLIRIFSTI
jgi:hypothetical protein